MRYCHAVGVYADEECGVPVTVVPLFEWESGVGGRCIRDGYFGESVSVRLICEDLEGHHEGGHDHHREGYEEGVEDREMSGSGAQKPKGKGGPFSGLGL